MIKKREDVARFIEKQMTEDDFARQGKRRKWHYGTRDLRDLLDFIYGSEPSDSERISSKRNTIGGDPDA